MNSLWKKVFDKKMLIVFFQGFSSGLPLLLTGETLKALLTDAQVDLKTIGLFSLVGLPYTFKFLWSFILDSVNIPILGLRKGWLFISQVGLMIPIFFLGGIDPINNLKMLTVLSFLVAFLSATQDIVIDAYRRELFKEDDNLLGLASSYYVTGYRMGMIVSNSGALALAQFLSWKSCYQIMASCMLVGVIVTLLIPKVEVIKTEKRTLYDTLIGPFAQFFKRKGALEVLFFILIYKLGDSLAGSMATPFYLKLGFLKIDIAAIVKGIGVVATIVGGYCGGIALIKLGMKKALFLFGIGQMLSTFVFSYLAMKGQDYSVLSFTIFFENFTAGMGTAAYSGFMASLTSTQFTATQYALLTSLMSVPRVIFSSGTGYMAESLGWVNYFLVCGLVAIPGLLLIWRFDKWEKAN